MLDLIFDACSLIYLTKIKIKEKLPLLGEIQITSVVKQELLADIEKFQDAQTIKKNIQKKNLSVIEQEQQTNLLNTNRKLGKGELNMIEACKRLDKIPVTDDIKAINFALTRGLKPKTSEIVLLDFYKEKIINYEEFLDFFDLLAVFKSLKPNIVQFMKVQANQIKNQKSEKK